MDKVADASKRVLNGWFDKKELGKKEEQRKGMRARAADCFKDFGGHATSSAWIAKQEELAAEKAAEQAAAEAKRAQRDEARAAKRDTAMALANKQFVRMRKLGFDEQKFAGDKEKPKLLSVESMVAVLVHKCGADEKNLRNKDQFKDRNAILALFRTKLEVFQEAGATG